MLEIFQFFSKNISQLLKEKLLDRPMEIINTLEEIRIRSSGYMILKFLNKEEIISTQIKYKEIIDSIQIMCDNSIYSYQHEICSRIYNNKRWS